MDSITYKRSRWNPEYWVISLNGRAWRVMHTSRDPRQKWPEAEEVTE